MRLEAEAKATLASSRGKRHQLQGMTYNDIKNDIDAKRNERRRQEMRLMVRDPPPRMPARARMRLPVRMCSRCPHQRAGLYTWPSM